ncbi:MAG TPA: PKD domain-containing protein, partial [Bacteroidales bacterium]|nr:PKD domain-containing protein [Bacteroidales bacterium]
MFIGYKNIWRTTHVRQGNPAWVKISDNLGGSNSNNMRAVESSPANQNILYISRSDSKFFRSDNCMDGAPVWFELTSNLPVSGTPSSIEASPVDENVVYITIGSSVYKSGNKGLTWTNISGNMPGVTKNTIAYYKNDNEGLYVGTDAGVYYKNSTMTNWVSFNAGMPVNGRITELDIYYDNDSVSEDAIRASSYGRGLWGSSMYQSVPDVDFVASATTSPASCSISFTDLSVFVPTSWIWTFDGGTPASSTLKNPTGISYNTPGTYTVKLKASNAAGSDSLTKTGYIHITASVAPVAEFSSDRKVVCAGEVVRFTDETQNCPNAWLWEFAPPTITYMEGTSSTSQNPVVAFGEEGEYTVRLTAFNNTGSNSITKLSYILYGGYRLPFTEDFENGFGRNNWTIQNADGNVTWDTISVAGTVPGHIAAWMNFFNYTTVYKRDQLISSPLNFKNYEHVTLSFEHAYAQRANIKDSLIVKLSSDCGNTWTKLLSLGPDGTPNTFVTHLTTLDSFYPQSVADWCGGGYGVGCYTVDLTSWAGLGNVKIMFEAFNRGGNNLFLDNIMITDVTGIPGTIRNNSGISIFPNPSTGIFNLVIPKGNPLTEMDVTAPGGQIVYKEKLKNGESAYTHQINLSHLARGVYFIHFKSNTSNSVEKIIIN